MANTRLKTPQAKEEHATVKARYARFFWPVLRAMVLIGALCVFIRFLAAFLYGGNWVTPLSFFGLASFVLMLAATMFKPETLPAIEGDGATRQLRLPNWSLVTYCVITGLGFNWLCAFLWFSRRYAFFSAPVIGATGLMLLFYAAIALLVARLTRRNWRIALLVFAFAPGVLALSVLRLGLLQ